MEVYNILKTTLSNNGKTKSKSYWKSINNNDDKKNIWVLEKYYEFIELVPEIFYEIFKYLAKLKNATELNSNHLAHDEIKNVLSKKSQKYRDIKLPHGQPAYQLCEYFNLTTPKKMFKEHKEEIINIVNNQNSINEIRMFVNDEFKEYFNKLSKEEQQYISHKYDIEKYIDNLNQNFKNENIKQEVRHIILFKVTWYEKYQGIEFINEHMIKNATNADNYLKQYEKYNFKNFNGKCYGFGQINGNKCVVKEEYLGKNVFVIFVAKNPEDMKDYIVGFYENARMYGKITDNPFIENNKINMEVDYNDAYLIPIKDRIKIEYNNRIVPQAGLRYANEYIDIMEYLEIIIPRLLELKNNIKLNEEDSYDTSLIDRTEEILNIDKKEIKEQLIKTYPRNWKVVVNCLENANYKCEYDNNHHTFIRNNGTNYTEVHHLIPLSQINNFSVNLDIVENTVSLCPNCHRMIHNAKDKSVILKKLYDLRKEHLKKKNIDISFEELVKIYNN